jgi:hypothetical protein
MSSSLVICYFCHNYEVLVNKWQKMPLFSSLPSLFPPVLESFARLAALGEGANGPDEVSAKVA